VGIGEGFFLFSLKISFVLILLSAVLPTITILDVSGFKDGAMDSCKLWFDVIVTTARAVLGDHPFLGPIAKAGN
jgi:hypothetical protein